MQKPVLTKRNGRELAKIEEEHPNKQMKMSLDQVSQDSFKLHWLNETQFLDKEWNQIFGLNDPIKCGIRCVKYEATFDSRHQTNKEYISLDAHSTHRWLLTKHLGTNTHQEALRTVEQQITSPLARQAAQANDSTIKCAADQIESTLDMYPIKQQLISQNAQLIKQQLSYNSRSKNLKFGACIDESTDIATLNQFVTFTCYLDENGLPQTSFLDVRPLSSKGDIAQNLYETFIQVSVNHGLNLDDPIWICVDGASAMIGCLNSMTSKLKDIYPFITIVHYRAHRLNLASLYAIKGIVKQPLRIWEAVTQQLQHYFAASPLHASILAAIHSENEDEQI
ncbi:MAG: hypothetical protein EZS28_031915 [Streblomastix strix]|uniref:DUF4371 domain-containing protein n=1 Tax=Streblomastix strix TaxID=222440 RepID=A0A5J4UQ82_9EUKA|nr:MAG: hypothetical protein EZS28_031915 [Streblomastix strix]